MEIMIFLAIPSIILVWAIVTYNRFIALRRMMEEAWSGVAVQLKRRHDQIPNLIETVKGYAGHEQKLLLDLANMRGMSFGTRPASTDMVRPEEDLGRYLCRFSGTDQHHGRTVSKCFLGRREQLSPQQL